MQRRRGRSARVMVEALESRTFLSAAVLDAQNPQFVFHDADGDQIVVNYEGAGSAEITLDGDAPDGAHIASIVLAGADGTSKLELTNPVEGDGDGDLNIGGIAADGGDVSVSSSGVVVGGDITIGGGDLHITGDLGFATSLTVRVDGNIRFDSPVVYALVPGVNLLITVTPFGPNADAGEVVITGGFDENRPFESITIESTGTGKGSGGDIIIGPTPDPSDDGPGEVILNVEASGSGGSSSGGGLTLSGGDANAGSVFIGDVAPVEPPSRNPSFTFTDVDGDIVTVRLRGTGRLDVNLDGGAENNADIDSIRVWDMEKAGTLDVRVKRADGGDGKTTIGEIDVDGSLKNLKLKNVVVDDEGVDVSGWLGKFYADALIDGADLTVGETYVRPIVVDLLTTQGADGDNVEITLPGGVRLVRVRGDMVFTQINAAGDARVFDVRGALTDSTVRVGGTLKNARVYGDVTRSNIATGGDANKVDFRGSMIDSLFLAGAVVDAAFDLVDGVFGPAVIKMARIRGDMIDSILAAGGDPGDDGLFEDGEVIAGSLIKKLIVDGIIVGANSQHINPGIYAAELGRVTVNRLKLNAKSISAGLGVQGTAVIDPLPLPGNALTAAEVETILEQAIARADQLGVAATIAIMDREGNPLGIVRMDGAEEFVDIDAGGVAGLEAVDGIVKTSLIAATKAGTAAFLSTSSGNAFTTRTAGQIIQSHFPPGVSEQDGGPLFGVQLSSLPTSDVNRLPLGLSADPGGIPLYRGGELIGGIGVEVDGIYTVDPTGVGGAATVEELIALAGQIGLQPPKNIQADHVFVDGIRLDYANGRPPSLASLGVLPDIGDPDIDVLFAPAASPASNFSTTLLGTIVGEVPDNALVDFFDGGALAFLDGDEAAPGVGLTAADVETILLQGHTLNQRLRAQIRRDNPQISQVTVSVVDFNGNLLGSFRSPDAPVFGYDVSVQKARTAAFFSRADAGIELTGLDTDLAADIATAKGLGIIDPGVAAPFDRHVVAAAALGVDLDGTVAVADRTGGFLSRPNLPDGIDGANPGPFSARGDDVFSPFNTGLQTLLMIPPLVDFLTAFNGLPEATALSDFFAGTLSGPGSVPNDDGSGGLPASSLNNGMQIFAGSVPLYKDGELVGAVGVSGDGIEQDDFIAFTAATGFQEFGTGVTRADNVVLPGGIRLPYVKLPRSPFAGV